MESRNFIYSATPKAYPLFVAPPVIAELLQQWRQEVFACLKGCGFCQGPGGLADPRN